jgi:flagellar biosynthesis protein FlhA
MQKYRKINLFTLELGRALCNEEYLEDIMKSIVEIRNSVFDKYGVVIPYVRVIDNQKLFPYKYVIKVSNNEVALYSLKKDSILIIDTGCVTTTMKGSSTKDPAFDASSFWISSAKEDEAKENGYVVASYNKIIKVHFFGIR